MEEKKKFDGGKVIITSILVLVTAAVFMSIGYFAGTNVNKETSDLVTPTTSATTVAKKSASATTTASATATSATADWKTYTNEKYGFKLTFNDLWKGYKVVEEVPVENSDLVSDLYLRVYVPTSSSVWSGKMDGYWDVFTVSVYSLKNWENLQAEEGPKPTMIDQNSKYVFGFSTAQDNPSDGRDILVDAKNIKNTFQFTK